MTNKEIAQELLQVLSNSQHHNPAWALKETLEKLRELISGTNENDGWEYSGNFDAFVKFSRELYDKAKWEGYYDGYEMCSIDTGGEE